MQLTDNISLTLTAAEWQVVFALLRKGTHEVVDPIWQKIVAQISKLDESVQPGTSSGE